LDAEDLIRHLPTGMMRLDAGGSVVTINHAAAEILGSTRDDATGRPLSALHPELASMREPARRAEVRLERDGEPLILGYTSTALAEEGGVVVALSDITEDKAKAARQEHQRRLADLGRVVATVAHEIKNPVFAVSSLAQLLRSEDAVAADADLMECCTRIVAEASRISRLVEDLTALGRPLIPRPRLSDVPQEVGRVREDLQRVLVPLPDGRRGAVKIASGAALRSDPKVLVDPDALRVIVACLVRNAWRAIAELDEPTDEQCTIDVTLDRANGDLLVSVADHGRPIRDDELAAVFEPFFHRGPYGAGLALTIVKGHVEQLGGTVQVRSSPDTGTVFEVALPGGERDP